MPMGRRWANVRREAARSGAVISPNQMIPRVVLSARPAKARNVRPSKTVGRLRERRMSSVLSSSSMKKALPVKVSNEGGPIPGPCFGLLDPWTLFAGK